MSKAHIEYGADVEENKETGESIFTPMISIDIDGEEFKFIANFHFHDEASTRHCLKDVFEMLSNPEGRSNLQFEGFNNEPIN